MIPLQKMSLEDIVDSESEVDEQEFLRLVEDFFKHLLGGGGERLKEEIHDDLRFFPMILHRRCKPIHLAFNRSTKPSHMSSMLDKIESLS